MRSSSSASVPTSKAPTNKPELKAEVKTSAPVRSTQGRPYSISNANMAAPHAQTHTDQVKAALDTLGIKLIKSEAERDLLKKLVEETRSTQTRLERELLENRKELADTRKRLDEQKNESDQSRARHERLEEKLREAQAASLKLNRKVESDEQKRARMQRRMERLENIATEAQSALQSRAMVLLTDQTTAQTSGLPTLPAHGPALGAPQNKAPISYIGQDDIQPALLDEDTPWWQTPARLSTGLTAFVVAAALTLGWGISTLTHTPQQSAVAVLSDGSLARIDLTNGTLQPLQLSLKKLDSGQIQAPVAEGPSVSPEGNPLPHNKPIALNAQTPAPAKDDTLTGALKDLQDKAYAGIPEAQHDLAALYTAGSGVKQDYTRAAYWFRQAALAGISNAAYNLGVLHHQGLGVAKDITQALDWYRTAALQGHPEAQYNLGIAYIEGIGARYNPQLAAGFFQKAALSGITEAAYNLGLILENGLLSEPKPTPALLWYRLGAESGSNEARNALDQLAARLGIAPDKAGYLPDGTTLAKLVVKPDTTDKGDAKKAPSASAIDKIMPELAELIPNDDQLLTAQIQEQLTRRKLYDGPQDGAMSQKTRDAIKTYQHGKTFSADKKSASALLMRMLAQSTTLDEQAAVKKADQ